MSSRDDAIELYVHVFVSRPARAVRIPPYAQMQAVQVRIKKPFQPDEPTTVSPQVSSWKQHYAHWDGIALDFEHVSRLSLEF